MNNLLNFPVFHDADNGGTGGENPADNQNNNDKNNPNNDNKGNPSDDSNKTGNVIPYDRFKEVNENYKTTKKQLDDLLEEKRQADENTKKEQGEFETLYNNAKTELYPLKEEYNKYQEVFKEMLENRLEDVPEEYKDLIPNGNPIEQMKWLENATKKGLFKKNNVQSFGNSGNNPDTNTEVTQEEFNKMKYTERVKLKKDNPNLYNKLS